MSAEVAAEPLTAAPPVHASPHAYPPIAAAWMGVAILITLSIVSQLDRNLIALLAPFVQADLRLSEVQVGTLIGTAYATFYTLGALPIGWALDRFDRRRVLWAGVTVWSLAAMACGLARDYWTLFAARAVVGAGEATVAPGGASLLPDLFPPRRLALAGAVNAISVKVGIGASLALGGVLAGLLSPGVTYDVPLLGARHGWQLIFIVAGAPGLLLGLLAFGIPHPPRARPAKGVGYPAYARWIRRNPRFFLGHQAGGLPLSIVATGVTAWMPSVYMRLHDMSAHEVGLRMGLATAIGPIVALPLHGWITDRLYSRGMRDAHLRYLMTVIAAAIPAAAGALLASSARVSLILLGLFFALTSAYLALPSVVLQLVVPAELLGKALGAQLFIAGLFAVGSGPVIVAALTDLYGGPQMVARSLLTCVAVGFPVTLALYAWILKPTRGLVEVRAERG